MSGRFGQRLVDKNDSSSNISSSVGLSFLEAEKKYLTDDSSNEYRENRRKRCRSNSQHSNPCDLNYVNCRAGSGQTNESIATGSKRSSSHGKQQLNKHQQNHNPPKELSKQIQNKHKEEKNNKYNEFEEKSNSSRKHNNDSKSRNFRQSMTFTRMQQISLQDSTDIIRYLANSSNGLDEFLSGNIKPDHMYLIIKILSRLTASDWEANKEHVLLKTSTPEFLKKITEFVTILVTDKQNSRRREEMEHFFENLLTFFQAIIIVLPSVAADHLQVPMRVTHMALGNVTEFQNISIKSSVHDKMKQLMSDLDERKKEKEQREKIEQNKKINYVYPKPLGSICNVSIYPCPEDIYKEEVSLVSNKIEGPYKDVEHYLDIHFQLLREDFISPLRKGINEYRIGHCNKDIRGKKKVSNIRIYNNVTFLKPTVIADKVGYDICFDPKKRIRVKWETTKRFIFGSLLIFTTDNFKTFFLATVVKRDLKQVEAKRVITIVLCDTSEVSKELTSKEFLMAESDVYFEPYYNVLKALQKFNSNTFPLKQYIIYVNKKTEPPIYTRNGSDVYTISMGEKGVNGHKTFKLFEDSSWPSCCEMGLDGAQLQAFKAALTNDLVVIQGPPGTGKTYLGLKIAGALLENSVVWNFDNKTPILVICFTNHALDQFLEGILENGLTNNLIRIGGRSKSELLQPFNLRERRRSAAYYTPNSNQAALLRELKLEITTIFENIKAVQENLEHFNQFVGILSLKSLNIVMNDIQKTYFRRNDDLLQWLMLGVTLRSQHRIIVSSEKGVETNEYVCEDITFDPTDIENFNRLKEVLFDEIDFEEANRSTEFIDSVRIYYCLTLDEIDKKIEEYNILLQTIPSVDEPRHVIQEKMRNAKKAHSDLLQIHEHLKQLFQNNTIPSEEDTNRLYKVKNLDNLNVKERWTLYKSWIQFLKVGNWALLQKLEERFRKRAERYDETRQYDDLKIIQQMDVVGITTTTAARLQAMLRELRPKIVIVEEAAEVLEAHIVASLSVHCQHLILIGDHKQLRPSPADYFIGKNHHLDISLFERLINNGIGYYTLNTQHRMRPEISSLLVPTIYPKLTDHSSTCNRPKILGLDQNVFFMNHNHFEEEVNDIMSKRNLFEARMAMGLARHLLLQGYRPNEITVLTTYSGQMYLLKEEQQRLEIPKGLLVTVVDNFQGEENKIIILSLVRSNGDNKIGFLKTDNRVCVALSRARDGLFIFGNMDCLCATSELWQEIRNKLVKQESFGPSIILRCETHPNELSRISSERDWSQVIEGGCRKQCGEKLPCGHMCRSLCHVSKDRHTRYRCSQLCNKPLCSYGHLCLKKCYETCGRCNELMERILSCGHRILLPCYADYRKMQCKEKVTLTFQECGHTVEIECFQKDIKVCPEPCFLRLECGHQCIRTCHPNDDPDHIKYMCPKPCCRPVPQCTTEGHQCPLACFEDCEPCKQEVVKPLACGHMLTVPCIETQLICNMPCNKTLPCGHPCKNYCFEECGDCLVKVEKKVPLCGHTVMIACSKTANKSICEGQCCVKLACGHKCTKRCKDICSQLNCIELTPVSVALPCGHSDALVPCNLANTVSSGDCAGVEQETLLQYCREPCLEMLGCSHRCTGTCGQCMQGRIHKVCDADCNNTLICGHSCPVPCRNICPPCKKNCQVRCIHNRCPKKCGEPCVSCKEPCEYRCVHSKCKKRCGELCDRKPCTFACFKKLKCSHPCVGFCGEPCPPCKVCYPQHFEPFAFTGEEDEPETKWVLLNDCKHVVDAPNLERWLGMDQQGSEIALKRCPKCEHTNPNRHISTTQRYMNLVKTTMLDIQAVKKKCFGQIDEIRRRRIELLEQVNAIPFHQLSGKDELMILRTTLLKELSYITGNRRNEISDSKIMLLTFKYHVYSDIQKRVNEVWKKLTTSSKTNALRHMNIIINKVNQRHEKISEQEIESFGQEILRIHKVFDLLVLESSNNFRCLNSFPCKEQKKIHDTHVKLKEEIYSLNIFTLDINEKINNMFKEISPLLQNNITDDERIMVHTAMAKIFGSIASTNRWYKCAGCGDVYCVENCGEVNQILKCRLCRTTIGDHNRIRDTNMTRALCNISSRGIQY